MRRDPTSAAGRFRTTQIAALAASGLRLPHALAQSHVERPARLRSRRESLRKAKTQVCARRPEHHDLDKGEAMTREPKRRRLTILVTIAGLGIAAAAAAQAAAPP